MTRDFVDPQSPFTEMARNAVADAWGKQAADLAKAAGQHVDDGSIDNWLDQSELADHRQLQAIDPAGYQDLRNRAIDRAYVHAKLVAIWRS